MPEDSNICSAVRPSLGAISSLETTRSGKYDPEAVMNAFKLQFK